MDKATLFHILSVVSIGTITSSFVLHRDSGVADSASRSLRMKRSPFEPFPFKKKHDSYEYYGNDHNQGGWGWPQPLPPRSYHRDRYEGEEMDFGKQWKVPKPPKLGFKIVEVPVPKFGPPEFEEHGFDLNLWKNKGKYSDYNHENYDEDEFLPLP